jgi:colanic acid/amylovoran biosynthesis glycosyltransferase
MFRRFFCESHSHAKVLAHSYIMYLQVPGTQGDSSHPLGRVTIIVHLSSRPDIRIAYLVSQYPAVNHTFILREILELRRLGFDISVTSIRAADRPLDQLSAEELKELHSTFYVKPRGVLGILGANIAVFFRQPFRYVGAMFYALRLAGWNIRAAFFTLAYLAEAAVVVDWMRRQNLVHLHMHFTSTVGLLAGRLAPLRLSATIHGPAEFDDPAGFYLAEKIRAFQLLCTISEYGRSQLMKFSEPAEWTKFHVARLGVDPALYAPRPFRENPSPIEILFVGRLAPVKGPQVLIAAMDRLIQQGHHVRLRFVGDGPERAALERSVNERGLNPHVNFEGWRNAEQVRALYQQADIFALPSFAEGIPVVLMEAMAMEIPCVTTRITGIPELIRDQVDGLLVAPANAEELAAAIARLMDDPELRRRIGRAARQRVVEDYDLRRNTAQLAQIFRTTE